MKLHFYLFTFQYSLAIGGFVLMNSSQGFIEKNITLSGIKNAKLGANVPLDSSILGISYLGHMTPEEFNGKE